MKKALFSATLAAVGLVALLPSPASAKPQLRPNVVVVMTDDQDFRSMWAMPKTRRLVRQRGTKFATSVVNFPLCCPSRATYLSGQYAHNHGVEWNNWPEGGYYRFNGRETLPVWLRRVGYRTIHVGKYLNEYGERDPFEVPRGWSEWWGGVDPSTYDYYDFTLNHNGELRTWGSRPRDYSTDVFARIAAREIRDSAKRRRPFFLSVNPLAPHTVSVNTWNRREGTPAVPAPRHGDAFADSEMPRYPNFNDPDISDKPAIEAFFPVQLSEKEINELTAHYRGRMGSLLAVDDLVAKLKRALRRSGEARDTVVIFTSDNGWILGEHRLRDPLTETGEASGVKFVPYEGAARVPLVISGPGFPRGEKVRGLTTNADLAPTILDLADADAGLAQDGRSLLRVAKHPRSIRNRAVLIETFENPRNVPPYASIRTRRYRYDLVETGAENLFDLRRDPWELQSLQDDERYDAIQRRLARKLERLRTCAGRECRNARVRSPKPTGEPLEPR